MDYIHTEENGQLSFVSSDEFLMFPSNLYGFHNTETDEVTDKKGRRIYCIKGTLALVDTERKCPYCGAKMHVNSHPDIKIRHLPFGDHLSVLVFPHNQLRCPKCNGTKGQFISFKADDHMITVPLLQYTNDLLATGNYTNKEISQITGLGENTVKDIDKKRLLGLYTTGNGTKLIQPKQYARYLGIDEFKLHNGHKYATHIIDFETGHILWIQEGKSKQVVYDFIDHVGLEWMDHVEAVACDMNSDFQEAFEERCEYIQPVFDYFHIIKNFNDKVINPIRNDERERLYEAGDIEAAQALKKTKYILTSNRSTLQRKDEEARNGQIIHKGSSLFKTHDVKRKEGYEAKYDELLRQNKLLFTAELVKEKVAYAYTLDDETEMAKVISEVMDICTESRNVHLRWFRNLLDTHFEGIIAHATYKISAGKIEGINQRIKTLRRQGYGYPDDEYFFLKLIDMSHSHDSEREESHRNCD